MQWRVCWYWWLDPPFEPLPFDLIPADAVLSCREPALPNQVVDHVQANRQLVADLHDGQERWTRAASGGRGWERTEL